VTFEKDLLDLIDDEDIRECDELMLCLSQVRCAVQLRKDVEVKRLLDHAEDIVSSKKRVLLMVRAKRHEI